MRIRIRVLILLIIFIVAAKAGKLTEKENEDRLKDCGRVKLSQSEKTADNTVDENAWVVRIHNEREIPNKNDRKNWGTETFDSLASFISRKHVVTSAQTILAWNKKWSMNSKLLNESCDSSGHVEVPEKYAKNIEIYSEHCAGNASCVPKSFQPEKAWILKMCKQERFGQLYAILLIEVKESDVEFGCLANQYTKWAVGDSCHAYGIQYKSNQRNAYSASNNLREVVSTIKGNDTEFVYLTKYHQNGDRGGPLVVEDDNKSTIIGIGASPGLDDDKFKDTYFFNVQHYQEDFCSIAGICPPPETTPAPTTTTEPTPITTNTPLMPTNPPPGTVTPASPSTPRPIQPKTPEINRRPDIRSTRKPDDHRETDEDKEDYEDEVEYGDGEDFFVSEDFLDGSGKMGLNFVMFVAVLALVLVF